jgi:hypothetical protein
MKHLDWETIHKFKVGFSIGCSKKENDDFFKHIKECEICSSRLAMNTEEYIWFLIKRVESGIKNGEVDVSGSSVEFEDLNIFFEAMNDKQKKYFDSNVLPMMEDLTKWTYDGVYSSETKEFMKNNKDFFFCDFTKIRK